MIVRKPRFLAGAAVSILALTGVLAPLPVAAVPFDDQPKILLHARPHTTGNACAGWGNLADCRLANTAARVADTSGPFYFVYLLVATGPLRGYPLGGSNLGLAGVQCGIQYDGRAGLGTEVFNWSLCGTFQFALGDWPGAGSGNMITWDRVNACQREEVAVAGYFYCAAYSPDVLGVIPRPVDHLAAVADCGMRKYDLTDDDLGSVVFSASGTVPGRNPCLAKGDAPVPTVGASWSQIKSLY